MNKGKIKLPQEWFKQAEYDFDTALSMLKAGRYIYTIFMCHLTVEKSLKGLYAKVKQQNPPKTHDLNYLYIKVGLEVPREYANFIDELDDLGVVTRYPDELRVMLKEYKEEKTKGVLQKTKELLAWLKKQF